MPLPEPIARLLAAGRRRLTAIWLTRRTATAVATMGAFAAALVAVARQWVIPWAEPVAWGGLGLAVAGSLLFTLARRPSNEKVAQEIDRRLGGFDRVTTALELTAAPGPLAEAERRQVRSAEVWSTSRDHRGVGSIAPPRSLSQLAALTLAAALVLTVVPAPTDSAIAQIRAVNELIEQEPNVSRTWLISHRQK